MFSGGTSSDSTTIKEAVLSNFDLRIFLAVSIPHPPHPRFPGDEGGSLEGRVHFSPHPLLKLCHFLAALFGILYLNYVLYLRQHIQVRIHFYIKIHFGQKNIRQANILN